MIRKIPIKILLIIGLLVSGMIPTLVVSYINYRTTRAEMKEQVFKQLESVRNIKKEQIHNYFRERVANIATFSEDPAVFEAYLELEAAFKKGGNQFKGYSDEKFSAPKSYQQVHDRYFQFFKKLVVRYGFYDLFLLGPIHGAAVFTVRKEPDFGMRVSEIPSSFRDVWITAVREKRISLSDTQPYSLSNNIPAQFLTAPILVNGEVRAVIAVQISIDSIDHIMKERSGMWQTGETYLVGQDKKMRSDSYLDKLNHSVLASFRGTVKENGADTVASREALQGIEAKKIIIDYRKKRVLSAYTPLKIMDVQWGLIAEVDEDEINQQISRALNAKILLMTGLSVLALLLMALIIFWIIDSGIRNMVLQLERMINDILHGKLQARIEPSAVAVDFRRVMAHTNELLDAFVEQNEEKKKLEDQIHGTHRLEAIGTLAGGIAHDFNNILTSMFAYAQIVKTNIPKDSVAEENINELLLSIRRASELIEQILTFSLQVKTEDVLIDISKEIVESIKLFKAALPRNIQVETHLSSVRLPVKANPSQIHQVIMNLYTNAYQAMRGAGGTLTVTTEKASLGESEVANLKKGDYCKISVKDTGHGMNKDIQKRIFEPFFTTKPVGEGTGMGLSVVHGIIRRCGGAIRVESEPGEGAHFDVFLPLARWTDFKKAKRDQEVSVLTGKGTILFVDDDAQICDSQKKVLEPLGYTVKAFQDSRMAVEAFTKNPDQFDLLIVDLNMPHLNGFELTEIIRKIRVELPVILTTGYAEMIDTKKMDQLDFHSLLLKPYRLTGIASRIAEILKPEKTKQT